jgi:arylsulfatase A-like enzyme
MVSQSVPDVGESPPQMVREAPKSSLPAGTAPATILLVAAWIGLVGGFLDLGHVGLLIFKQRLIDGDRLVRLGGHFGWIIPAGVAALVLLPGLALAFIALFRRAALPLALVVGVLSFVGFLEISARLPLAFWSSLLLCGGLATQFGRVAGNRRRSFLWLVNRTTLPLAVVLLAVMLFNFGSRAWAEHRAVAALRPAPPGARNVLLIVWDTVRAANLSLHGYPRATTPNLERLAAQGVRFEHAFATSSWTLPSHASLFTGRWPHEQTADWTSPLDEAHLTLAEYLAAHGYDTAGFVANLDYCGQQTGLNRGFAHYEDYPIDVTEIFARYLGLGRRIDLVSLAFVIDRIVGGRTGHSTPLLPLSKEHAKGGMEIDHAFLEWLSWQQTRKRPFFAFLNYVDAHPPYEVVDPPTRAFGLRPSTWRDLSLLSRWNELDKTRLPKRDIQMAIDLYDDGIAYLDRRLETLLQELKKRGVLDDTMVIVTSDHGEHLGDHRLFFHGCSLYRQLVEVPLVIVDARVVPDGRVVAQPASLREVATTIVDLLNCGEDNPFPGLSLSRFWRQDAATTPLLAGTLLMETGRPIYLTNQGREPAAKGPMKSLIGGGLHYIRSADGLEELYHLESDPQEQFNVAGSPEVSESLSRFRDVLFRMVKKR